MLYLALAYSYKPEVRAFPAGVAWVMLVLLSLDLASRTQTRVGVHEDIARGSIRRCNVRRPTAPGAEADQHRYFGSAGFAALMVAIGILAAVPVYVFAAMRWHGRRSYRACVAVAGGATLFVWLLFSVVLRLALYPGLVFGGAA